MKMNKFITAGALALAFTGAASAQTVIRISGATAFRAATNLAIREIMDGEVYGYQGADFSGSNRTVFTGTVGGESVTISCRWIGSVGGMLDVAQDRLATDWPRNDGTLTTAGKPNHTAVEAGSAVSDIALSDTFPSSVGITGNTLVSQPVGVVPFFFVKGKSADATVQAVLNKITNINTNQAKLLLGGYIAASQLTGDEADASTFLFPVGRDAESGTRAVTYLELGFSSDSAQVTSTISGGVITKVTNSLGGGYNSNSKTATDLKTPVGIGATVDLGDGSPVEIPYGLIAYIGLSDIISSSNNLQSQVIAYNGSNIFSNVGGVWTPNYDLIYSGAYTLWGYEVICWRDTMGGTKLNVAEALKTKISELVTAPSGFLLSNMQVERALEGGPITHK